MDIHTIRKLNLQLHIGDTKQRGVVADFAHRYDLDPTYIRQILNGHRTIGEKSARNFEQKMGLPAGILDVEITSEGDIDHDQKLAAALRQAMSLPKEQQQLIVQLVETLLHR